APPADGPATRRTTDECTPGPDRAAARLRRRDDATRRRQRRRGDADRRRSAPARATGRARRLAAGTVHPPRPAVLPAVPAARRPARTLLGGELRLGTGPAHADPRPHGLG